MKKHLKLNRCILVSGIILAVNFIHAQTIDWSVKANPSNLSINSVAFRADGQKVLSGTNCHPASIRVFDVNTSNLDWDYNVGMTYMCIMGVTFSSNTNYIAAIEEFGNIFIFDNTGASPVILDTINTGTSYGFSTAISPGNDKVAVGCSNGKLKVYNLSDGTLANDIAAHSSWVTTVAYSSDGSKIVTGGSDDKVKIWSNNGTLLSTCTGHSGDITTVKVTPDNNFVVSSSKDNTIKVWNVTNGLLVQTISGHTNDVNGIDISPDGNKLVSASSDSTCKIWNLNSGALITTFGVADSGAVNTVAWSPSGDKIVTGNMLSDVVLWSIPTTLDVENSSFTSELYVYPNPAQNNVILRIPEDKRNGRILIYNELCQLKHLYSEIEIEELILDVTNFDSGLYYAVFVNQESSSTVKIIVRK